MSTDITASGTTLVLLHGWGLTPRVWEPLQGACPRVLTPALPGPGVAPAAWATALAAGLPAGCVVLGWSLGAQLALRLALDHPATVSRLILAGASPCFVQAPNWPDALPAATMSEFQAGFARDPAATLGRFVALQALGDARRREVSAALKSALSRADAAELAWGLELLAATDLRAELGSVTQPVHLVHGALDRLMPVAAAEWLATALPDACLTVFADAGHAPFLSRPAEFAALLAGFVAEPRR